MYLGIPTSRATFSLFLHKQSAPQNVLEMPDVQAVLHPLSYLFLMRQSARGSITGVTTDPLPEEESAPAAA